MHIRSLLTAAAASVLLAGVGLAGAPALAATAQPARLAAAASAAKDSIVPRGTRIAATSAAAAAIEAKVAAGTSLRTRDLDPTAQEDILDYGVPALWAKGIDGSGVTVAFIVTNPDPGLPAALDAYDTELDLPPADITEMALPAPADPSFTCQVECSPGEDQLDAEAIHSMAPYAKLLFVHPAVPETIGTQGWAGVGQAIEEIADRHLADVITVSLGDGEVDFAGDPLNPGANQDENIHSLDPAFLDAAARGVPVSFAAGDCGPTDPTVLSDTGQCTPAIGLSADHPADSPWVTAVGGTIPNAGLATTAGRTAPDALWTARNANSDAGGAGVSTIYPKPSWQQHNPALAGVSGRAYPDVSLDASDGTSQASPTWAGILALATQLNGDDLGTVNPALAALGPRGTAAGIVDVPAGFANTAYGVTGYSTAAGYDIASGWGTVYAPKFVPALVRQVDAQRGPDVPAAIAARQLAALQGAIKVSAAKAAGGTQVIKVTGSGYVPGRTPNGTGILDGFGVYPALPGEYGIPADAPLYDPDSTVPGQTWDTVTATLHGPHQAAGTPVAVAGPNDNGVVTVTLHAAGLANGTYTVVIEGDVLTQSVTFAVSNGKKV